MNELAYGSGGGDRRAQTLNLEEKLLPRSSKKFMYPAMHNMPYTSLLGSALLMSKLLSPSSSAGGRPDKQQISSDCCL